MTVCWLFPMMTKMWLCSTHMPCIVCVQIFSHVRPMSLIILFCAPWKRLWMINEYTKTKRQGGDESFNCSYCGVEVKNWMVNVWKFKWINWIYLSWWLHVLFWTCRWLHRGQAQQRWTTNLQDLWKVSPGSISAPRTRHLLAATGRRSFPGWNYC